MKVRTTTLSEIKKLKEKIQKKRAAEASKRRFEEHIRQIVDEIYPKDLFIRDRNVSKCDCNKTISCIIQEYRGLLDLKNDVFAPWGIKR